MKDNPFAQVTDSQPRVEGPVSTALHEVVKAADRLVSDLSAMEARLGPVMKPKTSAPPVPGPGFEPSPPAAPKSPMETTLIDVYQRLESLGNTMFDISNRIDL